MADLVSYEVARDHFGDDYVTADNGEVAIAAKQFVKGDTRTAPADVVKAIVGTVLVDPDAPAEGEKADAGRKTKVEPKGKNKAEGEA